MELRPQASEPRAGKAAALQAKAIELTRLAFEMTSAAGSGHPTSAASLAHLVSALMYAHMRWDPRQPDHPAGDRLVLSEGHACPIVYAACADLGVAIDEPRRPMTREDALDLRRIGSPVEGHPNPSAGFPFFPAATGSLGQGLSVAAGLALAARLDAYERRVYCILGDGESREGQVWEALDFVVDHGLVAVCPIFNCNGKGQTGAVSEQQSPERLAEKLRAFGCEVLEIDGHEPAQIDAALARHAQRAEEGQGRPVAVVARTVKGWGTPSLAGSENGRHGKPAKAGEELQRALAELEAERVQLPAIDPELLPATPPIPRRARGKVPAPEAAAPRSFEEALRGAGAEDVLDGGAMAPRKAYGLALKALGDARPDVVVLDGDVSNSTYAELFTDAKRFFECRIAEQHMVSCAAGLAAGGKLPFASSFGKFLERTYDQVSMALVGGARFVLCGSHVGVSLAADGPSQMAIGDAAWFAAFARAGRRDGRALLHVLTPADAAAAYALTLAAAQGEGSAYLRTIRPDVPLLDGRDGFELGGHRVVREGADLLIAAWGYEVHEALKACEELEEAGVSASVVDLYSIPFDEAALVELARAAGGRVLTIEDNCGGALGAAVAEALAGSGEAFELRQLFVRRLPRSGREPEDVLADLGLARGDIAAAARSLAGA